MIKTFILTATLLISLFPLSILAQVSIGDITLPEKAMLLEVKSNPANADNVTSDKGGLLLPRVMLQHNNTLQPFINPMDEAWNSTNQSMTKTKHTGLMVYNLSTTADGLKPGVYIWNGSLWNPAGSGESIRYFYPPAFNLPLDITQEPNTFDLYGEYEQQYLETKNTSNWVTTNSSLAGVPSPESGILYQRKELDYVVVYYDTEIIEITDIDEEGVMTYKVKTDRPAASSFLNLVFVIK